MGMIELRSDMAGRPRSNVGGVVLAAGLSRRFAGNKLLAPFMGKPLVRWVVEAARDSRLAAIVVVLGHEHERVRAALSDLLTDPRLIFIYNDRYEQGQSSSVIVGLEAIAPGVDAVMFLPADQPRLDRSVVDQLIVAFEQSGCGICHPVVAGRRCSPTIFGARHFPALRRMQGDSGGRSVIETCPDSIAALSFPDEMPFRDVDCPDDLAALLVDHERAVPNREHPQSELICGLGLEEARVIAICGAGGKTSLMAALARELNARGECVLATTTTEMAIEEAQGPWRACEATDADDLLVRASSSAAPVLAYGAVDRSRGRLMGLAPEVIDLIAKRDCFSRIIVEADGARRKPLKAPGPQEPVFPRTTDAVVIVAGASGLGQPLGDRAVFRAERWSALTGLRPLQPVTSESLARMVVYSEGLAKGAPAKSRIVLFINQADTAERLAAAERVLDCIFSLDGLVPERAAAGWLQPAPTIQLVRERARDRNEAYERA
jgi:probable selenium-dependent hydroxylase accessory protein YqeC